MRISKKQSIIFAFSVIGLFLLLVYGFARESNIPSEEEQKTLPPPEEQTEPSTLTLENFQRSEVRNGKKVWEIQAKQGDYLPESEMARVREATIWFYKEDGTIIRMDATEALLKIKGSSLKTASASKGVKIIYNDQVTITTEAAEYNEALQTVTSESHVTIQGERFKISGDGLDGNVADRVFHLQQNVESVLYPANPEKNT